MSSTATTQTCTQAPKFSRYRSVRKAAAAATPPPIPVDAPDVPSLGASQLNRAPSRYHRAQKPRSQTVQGSVPPVVHPGTDQIQASSPLDNNVAALCKTPSTAVDSPARQLSPTRQDDDYNFTGGAVQKPKVPNISTSNPTASLNRVASNTIKSPTSITPESYEAAREEALMMLEGEYDRLQKTKEAQRRSTRTNHQDTSELKRRPTQSQPPKSQTQPVYTDAPNLHVKRRIPMSMPETYHDAPKSLGRDVLPPKQEPKLHKILSIGSIKPSHPQSSTGLLRTPTQKHREVLQFDAPISAVNAGDRRVEVRLNKSDRGITLPVTPTTNSKDLLNSASIMMSETFDPRTSVLIESFSKLGLERPLRRYEHIRDVMNSWDADDQNHLIIMAESECQATGLSRSEAPEDTPGRTAVQMYVALRQGKWEKRWINLRPDGQMTMSKHENDGEGSNICHISDFDVYTPTAKQRKKLKPPKKLCFAVKSQQKSTVFLDGVNFVHFFATSEKHTADQLYTAVHTWRSWYLVHVLGEGAKKIVDPAVNVTTSGAVDVRPNTAQSTESVPYQLGSFKPLLDFTDFKFDRSIGPADGVAKLREHSTPQTGSVDLGKGRPGPDTIAHETARRGSRPTRGIPPSSFPAKLFLDTDSKRASGPENSDQPFTGGGLLARSVSTRRSQGSKASGQGIAGVAGRPLVDLTPASDFAEGSLLRKLEAWSMAHGENEPKIDRQRRIEANVRVGEGIA